MYTFTGIGDETIRVEKDKPAEKPKEDRRAASGGTVYDQNPGSIAVGVIPDKRAGTAGAFTIHPNDLSYVNSWSGIAKSKLPDFYVLVKPSAGKKWSSRVGAAVSAPKNITADQLIELMRDGLAYVQHSRLVRSKSPLNPSLWDFRYLKKQLQSMGLMDRDTGELPTTKGATTINQLKDVYLIFLQQRGSQGRSASARGFAAPIGYLDRLLVFSGRGFSVFVMPNGKGFYARNLKWYVGGTNTISYSTLNDKGLKEVEQYKLAWAEKDRLSRVSDPENLKYWNRR